MNSYELTIVIPAKTTPAKKKALQEKIEKVVDAFNGKIKKVEDLGDIELSYNISGNKSGIFMRLNLELERSSVKALDDKLKMDEEIIRYLVVREDS